MKNIETLKDIVENYQVPFLSKHIAEEIKNLFELKKIPKNKILIPTIIYNPKKGIKIRLGKNEFSNFHHFINWAKIHGFFILPKELILKVNNKQIQISSLKDVDLLKNFNEDTRNYLKTFINTLSFGALANIKNGNIFLGNIYLKNCMELFNYRNLFEKILYEIKGIYKKNYVKKATSEIIFAEILLNFIYGNKKLNHIDYSILSIDLATFNEDHNKKIDHILKIINPYYVHQYDIQLTIGKINKKKKEIFIQKFKNDLENPFVLLSLRHLFPNEERKEKLLEKEYIHYLNNKIFEKRTTGGNFFPYFFRNLQEGLVKGLREVANSILIFFIRLSNKSVKLRENSKIKISETNTILIKRIPKKFKDGKNKVYFTNIIYNNEPLAEMRLIIPDQKK